MVLFALFDMKMLFLGWKSQYNAFCETQEMLRDGLTTFYAQFCTTTLTQTSACSST